MEGKTKQQEWNEKSAIIAHSIAIQITSVENITNYGALEIADHVKSIIENGMKNQTPKIGPEIRDTWGNVIKIPGAKAPGEKKDTNR